MRNRNYPKNQDNLGCSSANTSLYVFLAYQVLNQGPSSLKLEDLMVLKRSPDLLNNVKIGQDQLQLIMKYICFMGAEAILVK